jgi:hypothetical protein
MTDSKENPIETEFEKHQADLVESFKLKLKNAAECVISKMYTDVSFHAVSDANINYKNHLREECRKEFAVEIAGEYSHYSWAHDLRMSLLKNHKDQLSNKIIQDLQEKVKSLEEHIEQLRRWR